MKNLETYIDACNKIIKDFSKKYYDYVPDRYDYMHYSDYYHRPICICDDYWDIEDMYLALHQKIPKDIVLTYYSKALESATENKPFKYNLYTYYTNFNNLK